MEVKPGYKQTDVGVIPVDWDTPQLGEILESMQLGGNYKNNERATNWPLIKMGNLRRGSINLDKLEFIDPSQPPASRDLLRTDDVLFNTRNTLDLVGKVALWRDELPEAYFNSNIMRMEFDEAHVSSKRFVNYMLNTPQCLKSLRGIAIGTTSVAAIYSRDLVKVTLALPGKAEQAAIAEALSDADALIESLEQLIAKKRDLKQGAMQALLTGKKRLPGLEVKPGQKQTEAGVIPEDWEARPVSTFGDIVTGGTPPTAEKSFWHGEYPWVTPTDISTRRDIYTSERCISASGLKTLRALPANSVLVTCIASIGKNAVLKAAGACNQQINAVIPNKSHVAEFLYYVFENNKAYLLANAGITATSIVSKALFKELSLPLPPTNAEQEAISTILSDMDAEIEVLEAKLAKACQIKQGMMQELLTGRTRLI